MYIPILMLEAEGGRLGSHKGVMESGSFKKAENTTHRCPKGSHKRLVLYPVFTFKECRHLVFYSVHSELLPPFFCLYRTLRVTSQESPEPAR